jgi:hypothetical protein
LESKEIFFICAFIGWHRQLKVKKIKRNTKAFAVVAGFIVLSLSVSVFKYWWDDNFLDFGAEGV